MTSVISGVSASTTSLAFSPDGRYLAAGLGTAMVCAFLTATGNGPKSSRDTDYGDSIYGIAFAADGRLAATS